jgi:hypothetical protein
MAYRKDMHLEDMHLAVFVRRAARGSGSAPDVGDAAMSL